MSQRDCVSKLLRFNRDIVECKADDQADQQCSGCRFNRDIVECKDGYDYNRVQKCVRFNRDIVECKVVVLYEMVLEYK